MMSSVGRLSSAEFAQLLTACRALPPAKGKYLVSDFVTNLLLTVIDFQMQTTAVERAIAHYDRVRRAEVRTMDDLVALLARFPDDPAGNTALAEYLWGYRLWTRAGMLRGLVSYFLSQGITTQAALKAWAEESDFDQFAGKVKGLGPAVYNWLVMRQGVETVKPDVHVLRFTNTVLQRSVPPAIVVDALIAIAKVLGLRAYELDWRIWEYQRGL